MKMAVTELLADPSVVAGLRILQTYGNQLTVGNKTVTVLLDWEESYEDFVTLLALGWGEPVSNRWTYPARKAF